MSFLFQHTNLSHSWTLAPVPTDRSEKKLLSDVVDNIFAVVRPPKRDEAPGYPLLSSQDSENRRLVDTSLRT
ncbi:hypothetical protein RUND412_010507 [Rhizina undulata]